MRQRHVKARVRLVQFVKIFRILFWGVHSVWLWLSIFGRILWIAKDVRTRNEYHDVCSFHIPILHIACVNKLNSYSPMFTYSLSWLVLKNWHASFSNYDAHLHLRKRLEFAVTKTIRIPIPQCEFVVRFLNSLYEPILRFTVIRILLKKNFEKMVNWADWTSGRSFGSSSISTFISDGRMSLLFYFPLPAMATRMESEQRFRQRSCLHLYVSNDTSLERKLIEHIHSRHSDIQHNTNRYGKFDTRYRLERTHRVRKNNIDKVSIGGGGTGRIFSMDSSVYSGWMRSSLQKWYRYPVQLVVSASSRLRNCRVLGDEFLLRIRRLYKGMGWKTPQCIRLILDFIGPLSERTFVWILVPSSACTVRRGISSDWLRIPAKSHWKNTGQKCSCAK